jgi:hypothetical protein
MSEKPVKNDLSAVEAALGALRPAPSGVDRDRLMYLAGEAAASRSRGGRRRRADWLWPCATAASVLLAVTFATMWFAAEPEVRIVYVSERDETPKPAPQPTAVTEQDIERALPQKKWRTDYLQLRRLVMTEGVDLLPPSESAPGADVETLRWRSIHERTLKELLEG